MTPIKWEKAPEKNVANTGGNNPWFATTIGLIGIIAGYLIGIYY